jgi:hypothetical protein
MPRKTYYRITRTFGNGIFDDAHESKSSVIVRKVRKARRTHKPRTDRRVTFDSRFGFEDNFFESESKMNRYMKKHGLSNILK